MKHTTKKPVTHVRTRRLLALTAAAGLLVAGAATTPATAHPRDCDHDRHSHQPAQIQVAGAVATPATYTTAQLDALTQTTLPDLRTRRDDDTATGTLLASLVDTASPVLPAGKNTALRVTLTVSGDHRRDTLAITLGELAPGNGNHPALLVPSDRHQGRQRGVDLILPGDRGFSRTVPNVARVEVAVAAPALPTSLPAGAIQVVDGRRTTILTAASLARLPVVTRNVAFQSGSGPQQHVETGPTLARVLRAARIQTRPTTTVAAIADDGYIATATPAEATAGRRSLLLALAEDGVALDQPRLVTDGDVSGGRYVSGVVSLEVGDGCRA